MGLKPRTIEDYRDDLTKGLAPLHAKPINAISRSDIVDLHETLTAKGPTSANRIMRFARAVFNFAVENDNYMANGEYLLQVNPVGVLAKRRLLNKQKHRHGFLTQEELGPWIKAVLSVDPLRFCETRDNGYSRVDSAELLFLLEACLGL